MVFIARKTHEQYVEEVKNVNPDIEVVGIYLGCHTAIPHKCLIDGCVWNARPANILNGKGCPKCSGNKKLTTQEYVELVNQVNSDIEVLEEYINTSTKILHRCLIDGYEWRAAPSNILRGTGCPKCAGNAKRTHEDYVNEVRLISPQIDVIDNYVNANTSILHRCKIHDVEWKAMPQTILNGGCCPKCRWEKNPIMQAKSHEQYIDEVCVANPNVEVLGRYINYNTKILHRCKKHNIEWETFPSVVLKGGGCPKCHSEKIGVALTKTHEEYVSELADINPDIIPISEYLGADVQSRHKCLICGNEWDVVPNSLLAGCGCPKCKESHGERSIGLWLDAHNIRYYRQYRFDDCRDMRSLPFDFYLPDHNICIEFDGRQHYQSIQYFGGDSSFLKLLEHDRIKNVYCRNHGIKLFRIPYFKDIQQELDNFLFI